MKTTVLWMTLALAAVGCSGDDEDTSASETEPDASAGADGDGAQSTGPTASSDSRPGGDGDTASGGSDSPDAAAPGDGSADGGAAIGGDGTGQDLTGIIEDGWEVPDALKLCGDRACQCADGEDNDGDGVADGFDAECTGPNDDDEGSFATGISGDNMDPNWQDCFFDGDSGHGNDGCRYHTDCFTGERSQDEAACQVTDECIEFCAPRAPNGCDCFGCCEIRTPADEVFTVVIAADCNEDNLGACTECVLSESECSNPCEECELCPGKTIADLPDSCFESPPDNPGSGGTGGSGGAGGTGGTGGSGGTGGTDNPPGGGTPVLCAGDETTCVTHADCSAGRYCGQGCCRLIPPE